MYALIKDGLTDVPSIKSLSHSIFSILPDSTSRIGLNQYHTDKQTSNNASPGQIPDVSEDSTATRIPVSSEPQLIVERYARLENRQSPDLPYFITNETAKICWQYLSKFIITVCW